MPFGIVAYALMLVSWTTFVETAVYSCFEKGCPTEKQKSVRDNTERHDGLWLFTVASSSSRVFSAMEGGAMNTCMHMLKEIKWILSCRCVYLNLLSISQTTFRHCRVRFYAFFGQPLSKQLYIRASFIKTKKLRLRLTKI